MHRIIFLSYICINKNKQLNIYIMKTINNTTVINGVTFKTYKHWSYEGNVGIYLMDGVSRVGEVVNNQFVFINNFTESQLEWLKSTQDKKTLEVILN